MVADLIGYVGVLIIVGTYFLRVKHAISAYRYDFWNIFGGVFSSFPVIYHHSIPNVITTLFWSAIAIYGVIQYRKKVNEEW